MKSILAFFLIAIISCTPSNPILKEKDPVEIIKCILSNDQIMDELGNIIVKIEEVIKNGDLSGLTSLLCIFSMVEEVKSCFEETDVPQLVIDEDVVLKGPIETYIGCVANAVINFVDIQSCVSKIKNCVNSLSEDDKKEIKEGESKLKSICNILLADHPIVGAICNKVWELLNNN